MKPWDFCYIDTTWSTMLLLEYLGEGVSDIWTVIDETSGVCSLCFLGYIGIDTMNTRFYIDVLSYLVFDNIQHLYMYSIYTDSDTLETHMYCFHQGILKSHGKIDTLVEKDAKDLAGNRSKLDKKRVVECMVT